MQFEQITYEVQQQDRHRHAQPAGEAQRAQRKLLRELHAALLEADEHNAVHCVVLRGAGPHFCAGADLSEFSSGRGAEYRGRQEIDDDVWRLEQGQRLRITLFDMHKPVIAQVHGTCIGIGTELAWFCDMVIVADDARIGFPPVRDLGTPPGSMWLYHCGPQWAKRLLLTGDSLTGKDAAEIGLALKSVPGRPTGSRGDAAGRSHGPGRSASAVGQQAAGQSRTGTDGRAHPATHRRRDRRARPSRAEGAGVPRRRCASTG